MIGKKRPPFQESNRKRVKKIRLELSLISMFFWGLGLFLLLAWIFVLGILVGRGFFPSGVKTLTEMKDQIAKLQDMVNRKSSSHLDFIEKVERDPDFEFYKELEKGRGDVAESEEKTASIIKKSDSPESGSDKGPVYVLQIASLEDETKAVKMAERLKDKGYPTYLNKVFLKGRAFYRVRCGNFKTREEADKLRIKMTDKEGLSGFVTTLE